MFCFINCVFDTSFRQIDTLQCFKLAAIILFLLVNIVQDFTLLYILHLNSEYKYQTQPQAISKKRNMIKRK